MTPEASELGPEVTTYIVSLFESQAGSRHRLMGRSKPSTLPPVVWSTVMYSLEVMQGARLHRSLLRVHQDPALLIVSDDSHKITPHFCYFCKMIAKTVVSFFTCHREWVLEVMVEASGGTIRLSGIHPEPWYTYFSHDHSVPSRSAPFSHDVHISLLFSLTLLLVAAGRYAPLFR